MIGPNGPRLQTYTDFECIMRVIPLRSVNLSFIHCLFKQDKGNCMKIANATQWKFNFHLCALYLQVMNSFLFSHWSIINAAAWKERYALMLVMSMIKLLLWFAFYLLKWLRHSSSIINVARSWDGWDCDWDKEGAFSLSLIIRTILYSWIKHNTCRRWRYTFRWAGINSGRP